MRSAAMLGSLILVQACLFGGEFTLKSPDVAQYLDKRQEYTGFGCSGDNLSPKLVWENAPEGTKSLALTVYDPDAPTGSGWWHWIVYNMPAGTAALKEGSGSAMNPALPTGAVQGRNDYGEYAFGGACPPEGDVAHRYVFTLFALDVEKLELPKEASAALIGYMLNSHAIEKATMTAKYGR